MVAQADVVTGAVLVVVVDMLLEDKTGIPGSTDLDNCKTFRAVVNPEI